MLAVAGLTFAYTSCTDYSKDIDENKNQIDAVSSELATAKQQIESLKTDVSNLQTAKAEAEKAISALQTSLKDLQTKHDADVKALEAEISKVKADYAKADEAVKADLQKKIDALTEDLKTAEDNHAKELKTVNGLIEELQGSVKTINGQIATINKTLETLATKQELADVKTWAETTLATKDAVSEVITSVSVLSQTFETAKKVLEQKDSTLTEDIKALNAKLAALEGQHASDVADLTTKIGEAKTAAAAAQTTANEAKTAAAAAQSKADQAEEHAQKALGDIEALKNALGVYAESGKLAATIKALVNADSLAAVDVAKKYDELKALRIADSTLTAQELAKKFNSSEFETEFGKYLQKAVEKDGIVNDSIAANIDRLRKEHENSLNALKTEVNTKFNALFSIAKQLKSLVFVPELYVDGIEATEYTYAKYNAMKLKSSGKTGEYTEYTEYGDGTNRFSAKVLNGKWLEDGLEKYTSNPYRGSVINYFMNPLSVVTYKMNPSTADVTKETPFALVTYDKEYIKTKASVNDGKEGVKFVSANDGELKVSFDAKSFDQNCERQNANTIDYQNSIKENMVSIFALQAKVKNEDGQDTTITSDFARLYLSKLEFENLAFTGADYSSTLECTGKTTQDHIYPTLKEAVENAPSVYVLYNGAPLNLDDVVTTHYTVTRTVNGDNLTSAHKDYDADLKAEIIDDFKVKYSYELIDYLVGTNETSESQHMAFSDDAKTNVVACNVTDGKRDESLIGDKARQSVGRRPIVMVKMTVDGKLVKVGFIKFEIREQVGYKTAGEFESNFHFYCGGDYFEATWGQMVDKILKVTGDTRETFSKNYKLETNNDKVAVQYFKVGEDFINLNDPDLTVAQVTALKKALGIDRTSFGNVTEELDSEESQQGTTTSVLRWIIGTEDLSSIYKLDGHKVTIWVRYKSTNVTTTTKYDGIYVPLTAIVDKPVSEVGVKLSNYWFNNGASAKINVTVPSKDLSKFEDKDNPTHPWKTDIDQVWDGNKPTFDFGENYPLTINKVAQYDYKYYFAPVQSYSDVIDGTYYEFFVDNAKVIDKYTHQSVTGNKTITDNNQIEGLELGNAADVTEGIYTNAVLKCYYIPTKDKTGNWKSKAPVAVIAYLDQKSGEVIYNYGDVVVLSDGTEIPASKDVVAKFLLNHYASVHPQYTEAILHAQIGVTGYMQDCGIATSLKGSVWPYYFLRPVNAVAAADKYFVDSEDQQAKESNIDLFDLFTFKDWRGKAFFEEPVGEAEPDYTNLWYFRYYNVNAVNVDIAGVTTDLSGGELGKTLLSSKSTEINLTQIGGGEFEWKATVAETWGVEHYKGVLNKFGKIHYHNNGTPIESEFTIRVPVSFTYTWGTIKSFVDIKVLPLGSK